MPQIKVLLNHVHHALSETFLSIAAAKINNRLKVTHFSKHLRELMQKFEDVSKPIEFHMTHYKGQFGPEHFNLEAIENRYGNGSISFTFPYITVVAHKD